MGMESKHVILRVLIVEDSYERQEQLTDLFREHAWVLVHTAARAIRLVNAFYFDLIALDFDLAGPENGDAVAQAIPVSRNADTPVLIHSMNIPAAARLRELLPQAVCTPIATLFKSNAVVKSVREALRHGVPKDWTCTHNPDKMVGSVSQTFVTVDMIRQRFYRSCTTIAGYPDASHIGHKESHFRIESSPSPFLHDPFLLDTARDAIEPHLTRVSHDQMQSICRELEALGLWQWPQVSSRTNPCALEITSLSSCSPYERKDRLICCCSQTTYEHTLAYIKRIVPDLKFERPVFENTRRNPFLPDEVD